MIRLRLLLLLPLCLLIGCNRPAVATPPTATGFSCTAVGTYRGEEIAGTLTRASAGLLTVTLTRPAALEGLTMEWNGESVSLGMLGLQWSLDPEKVPEAALGEQLLLALDTLVYSAGDSETDAEGRVVTRDADNTFTIYSDPNSGALLALEVPNAALSLTFSDFTKT